MNQKGQTALEYLLMVAVILGLLVLVISMISYVQQLGVNLGASIDTTRVQVVDWILT